MKQIETSEKISGNGVSLTPLATLQHGDNIIHVWLEGLVYKTGQEIDGKVMITVTPPVIKPRKSGLPIQYIGKRSPQREPQFGTGTWKKGQTKYVPPDIAVKMIKEYPGVFVKYESDGETCSPGNIHLNMVKPEKTEQVVHHETPEVEEVTTEEVEEQEDQETIEEEKLQSARDHVATMEKLETLTEYAMTNFGQKLPGTIKNIDTARQRVTMMIDQYGLP